MANRTDKEAAAIRGTNPQHLVEKITRSKIYNSMFWKEHCFALNAETIVDRMMELKAVGGIAFVCHLQIAKCCMFKVVVAEQCWIMQKPVHSI
jgi:hypothetical protein